MVQLYWSVLFVVYLEPQVPYGPPGPLFFREMLPMEHAILLPCPHCGGKAEIRHVNMADGIAVHAICHDCRASSPRILVCDAARAAHLAARAWNYRNPDAWRARP